MDLNEVFLFLLGLIAINVLFNVPYILGLFLRLFERRRYHHTDATHSLPRGFEDGDCAPRALSNAGIMPYKDAVNLVGGSRLTGKYSFSDILKVRGWKQYERISNRKESFGDFAKKHKKNTYILVSTGDSSHAAAVVKGKVVDSWDSTDLPVRWFFVKR